MESIPRVLVSMAFTANFIFTFTFIRGEGERMHHTRWKKNVRGTMVFIVRQLIVNLISIVVYNVIVINHESVVYSTIFQKGSCSCRDRDSYFRILRSELVLYWIVTYAISFILVLYYVCTFCRVKIYRFALVSFL